MKVLFTTILIALLQSPTTIVKNNGDELVLTDVLIYQTENMGSPDIINYNLRGKKGEIQVKDVRRISFKETIQKKKGITTYRVILVRNNNDKLDVEMDLVKIQGVTAQGKTESIGLGSVDKISF